MLPCTYECIIQGIRALQRLHIYLLLPTHLYMRVHNRVSLFFGPSSVGRRVVIISGGPINLISIYSYETFQGYIFMVFKISFGSTTAAVCMYYERIKMGWKKRKKKKGSRIQLSVFIRILGRLACRAEGKEYVYI